MDLAGLLDFVRQRYKALLITRRTDGSPQASPLTLGVDDSGRVVMSIYPGRAKPASIRRDPAVSVVLLSDEWSGS